MSVLTDFSVTIKKAASRARGDRLADLKFLCETQKTISTRKLLRFVRELEESDRQDAVHFRDLADFVKKHSH